MNDIVTASKNYLFFLDFQARNSDFNKSGVSSYTDHKAGIGGVPSNSFLKDHQRTLIREEMDTIPDTELTKCYEVLNLTQIKQ